MRGQVRQLLNQSLRNTFDVNLSSEIFMMEQLENIASTLELKHSISGKTVTLKNKK
jgi:DNA polymerase-4